LAPIALFEVVLLWGDEDDGEKQFLKRAAESGGERGRSRGEGEVVEAERAGCVVGEVGGQEVRLGWEDGGLFGTPINNQQKTSRGKK
jgi:hypothetical protein